MKRIIIIEDHPIVVFNLKLGLHGQDGIEVIETYNSGNALLSSQILEDIDLALLDINLPDLNGFEICKYLKANHPHIKIIGISSFEDYEHITQLLKNGANGYIVKGAKNSEMIEAINEVLNGSQYLCNTSKAALDNTTNITHKSVKLTKREQQIIELANIKPCIEFISDGMGESKPSMEIYFKMLKQKLEFYNININLPAIQIS
ncbi:response regulator [Sphingobacterium litopenaei]|uniref:Response regulator transcription factor n=1 Tax=Sphingobacterium litopenaei TaxID=2763500 RepID=A0ABR7YIA6_9SPHI|nr:response regulator transcription factor [Sphingobacterium litopenaei]MBD1431052.1 response regulator transcription factor [Sphingobacterium litopenaei]